MSKPKETFQSLINLNRIIDDCWSDLRLAPEAKPKKCKNRGKTNGKNPKKRVEKRQKSLKDYVKTLFIYFWFVRQKKANHFFCPLVWVHLFLLLHFWWLVGLLWMLFRLFWGFFSGALCFHSNSDGGIELDGNGGDSKVNFYRFIAYWLTGVILLDFCGFTSRFLRLET